MNGKIDKFGNLCIERAGEMMVMECRIGGNIPNGYYDHFDACHHRCPLFGEPYGDKDGKIVVDLCHRFVAFDTFTDERGGVK